MNENSVITFRGPDATVVDPLTEILQRGGRKLLAKAIEAEVEGFLGQYADLCDERGRQVVVTNGDLPERDVQTGIGQVKVPRVRDRSDSGIRFHSAILPPYLRRTKTLEALIPWLYLKGVSTGDFQEAGY